MPKINTFMTDETLFLRDVEASLLRLSQRVARQESQRKQESKSEYWREQRRKMNDPSCKSYHALTEFMV